MKASERKRKAVEEVQRVIDDAFELYHLVTIGGESHLYDLDYGEVMRSMLPLQATLEGASRDMEKMLAKGGINPDHLAKSIREKAHEAQRQEAEITEQLHHWTYKIRQGANGVCAQMPMQVLHYNLKIVSQLSDRIEKIYETMLDQSENHGGMEL